MKHVYHDSLWAYSGRKVPNDGFLADQVVASEGAPPAAAAAAAAADESDEEEAEEEEAEAEEEPMAPDELMNYCFYAALKTTCTDAELPLSADKFYSHHMQPARPAKQPPLDAKKSSFKQIGKFIKAMHKAKAIAVREVKNVITILSVDRAAKERHHPPHPPAHPSRPPPARPPRPLPSPGPIPDPRPLHHPRTTSPLSSAARRAPSAPPTRRPTAAAGTRRSSPSAPSPPS